MSHNSISWNQGFDLNKCDKKPLVQKVRSGAVNHPNNFIIHFLLISEKEFFSWNKMLRKYKFAWNSWTVIQVAISCILQEPMKTAIRDYDQSRSITKMQIWLEWYLNFVFPVWLFLWLQPPAQKVHIVKSK